MDPQAIITFDTTAALEAAIDAAEYALGHGRAIWSSEYIAHVEANVARLREIRTELESRQADDDRVRQAEQERLEQLERARREKGTPPWMTH